MKKRTTCRLSWIAVLGTVIVPLAGCGGASPSASAPISDTIVVQWNETTLEAIRRTRPGPTVSARMLAIVSTSMYDAWAAYDPVAVGTRLGSQLRQPESARTDANRREAISFAAYRALLELFPTQASLFNSKMARLGYDRTNSTLTPTTPAGVGNAAANALITFRRGDGANQLGDLAPGAYSDYTGYVPVNTETTIVDVNRWQPQRFFFPDGTSRVPGFLTPQWGRVTPFALPRGDSLRGSGPDLYPSSAFSTEIQEIINITAGLDDREKMIAEYWANGPGSVLPPGHWHLFAQYVSRRDNHTLEEDVKLFFILSNAMLDSSIACWDTKIAFDSGRPISMIRHIYRDQTITGWRGPGQGFGPIQGQNWRPWQPASFITPPFGEYTSGHSTFSAAGAEVLERFTGSDTFGLSVTIPAGSSEVEPGRVPSNAVVLSWETFTDAAEEAGMSRIYGGIHFTKGNLDGQAMGREVADLVWNRAQQFFNGTAFPTP